MRTVGFSTDGHGPAALAACPGLTCAAGPGVHPGVRLARVMTRGEGGREAGALMAGLAATGGRSQHNWYYARS